MGTCNRNHEEISFEGQFAVFCPLCALRAKLEDEYNTLKTESDEAFEAIEDERDHQERRAEEAQEELRAYKEKHP
jgi:cell division protein FtsB